MSSTRADEAQIGGISKPDVLELTTKGRKQAAVRTTSNHGVLGAGGQSQARHKGDAKALVELPDRHGALQAQITKCTAVEALANHRLGDSNPGVEGHKDVDAKQILVGVATVEGHGQCPGLCRPS